MKRLDHAFELQKSYQEGFDNGIQTMRQKIIIENAEPENLKNDRIWREIYMTCMTKNYSIEDCKKAADYYIEGYKGDK